MSCRSKFCLLRTCSGAGHRIQLHVANGDSPVFDMPFSHHYGSKIGTDVYYHDQMRPSHVLLPVRRADG